MCLAKAYVDKMGDEPVLRDIAQVRVRDGRVELKTLLGEEMVLPGGVLAVDFMASRIVVGEDR
jgi:predicted RNA-binding protein